VIAPEKGSLVWSGPCAKNMARCLQAITNMPPLGPPTIARFNVTAAGAGANLALRTDVVFATESIVIFFKRLRALDCARRWRKYTLPRQMGPPRLWAQPCFADKISARQADDWGMIWEAVADAEF